jgi:hypothetical protein
MSGLGEEDLETISSMPSYATEAEPYREFPTGSPGIRVYQGWSSCYEQVLAPIFLESAGSLALLGYCTSPVEKNCQYALPQMGKAPLGWEARGQGTKNSLPSIRKPLSHRRRGFFQEGAGSRHPSRSRERALPPQMGSDD